MRKMLAVLVISGSLAAGVSAAFANEGNGASDRPVTASPTAPVALLVPANGTGIVGVTSGSQAPDHEMDKF